MAPCKVLIMMLSKTKHTPPPIRNDIFEQLARLALVWGVWVLSPPPPVQPINMYTYGTVIEDAPHPNIKYAPNFVFPLMMVEVSTCLFQSGIGV